MSTPDARTPEERLAGKLLAALAKFLQTAPLGQAFAAGPRAVSFTRSDRLAGDPRPAPDLAAEVVSPEDHYEAVDRRIDDHLRAGVRLLWVISPQNRTARVHRGEGSCSWVREDRSLDGADVLPGFLIPLRSLLPCKVAAPAKAPARPEVTPGKDAPALAAAVVADPEDDLPRLAFADCCEENGDPEYAEFIRTQCSLARLPWDDPRTTALRHRERELLSAALRRYQSCLARCRKIDFERGFPRVQIAVERLLEKGELLHEAGPVLHVSLWATRGRVADVARCEALAKVPSLSLTNNVLTAHEQTTLFRSPMLRDLAALDLLNVAVGSGALRALAETPLPRLRKLVLAQTRLSDKLLQTLAAASWLGQLTELNLGRTGISATGLAQLVQSADLGRLESLDLTAAFLQDGEAFRRFLNGPGLGMLRKLVLAQVKASPGANRLAPLADASRLAELLELEATWCWKSEDELRFLANSRRLGKLQTLDLTGSVGSDAALLALAGASGLPALTTLRLDSCGIGLDRREARRISPEAFAAFVRSPFAARLRKLSLANNRIGDVGVAALVSSPNLGNLVELDLGGCSLSGSALRRLAGTALRGLRCLRLPFNDIDAGVLRAVLDSLPRLRELTLSQTSLTEQVQGVLRDRFALPAGPVATSAPVDLFSLNEVEISERG
jgi:uncharacterized protein (TIGR02996 family)